MTEVVMTTAAALITEWITSLTYKLSGQDELTGLLAMDHLVRECKPETS